MVLGRDRGRHIDLVEKKLPAGRFEMQDESGTLDGKGQEKKRKRGDEKANC